MSTGISEAPSSAPHGVARMRIAVLFVGYLAVAAGACRIFDRFELGVVLAPVLPTTLALVTITRSPLIRILAAVSAVIASVAIAVVAAGGGLEDLANAFSSGFQGLLSTEWPSPNRADLVGTVALVIAAATALSDELATRRRFHLLPLLPLVLVEIASVALSSPAGISWTPVVIVGVCATLIALLRNDGSLHDRLVLLRGERRLIPLLASVVAFVVVVTISVSLTARADPRRNDPPERSAPLLDPIEATLALRDLDPPVDLHVVTPTDGDALPPRWRTAALSDYDGDRWIPELTLRPIGRTLGTATGPTIDVDISFLDDDLSLVPLPGPPITVDAPVETDLDRTIVRLVERPDDGEEVAVVAEVAPTITDLGAAVVAPRPIEDDVSTLTGLAESLAGEGTQLEQLAELERTMRDEWVLDNAVQGGGLQRAFIDIFLRDTQRGNVEQFVTGFVLLARALGIESRVATGFVAGADAVSGDGTLALSSAAAIVWPEVQLADGRWVAYDPVPEREATDTAPPPPQPETQTPAAPQPPIAPPPDPDSETEPLEDPPVSDDDGALSTALVWGLRGAAVTAIVLLPFVVFAAVILGLKHRRRTRRLRAPSVAERIRGAWATATDGLVDAGLSIPVSSTDADIASEGEPLVVDARRDLHRLATLSSAATFGSVGNEAYLADDATRCLTSVEQSIISDRTRRQQLLWRLSLRSLRRSTRSPVTT